MKKTIGILAHVDAGKTTFAEQLLYYTKSIKKRGRVDHRDTLLDNHKIEKERGITVFSEQAIISYEDNRYYIIDTPGHVDFSPEMERAIAILDYAIIIISAVEGVEGHTETVWNLLRKHKVPTFFFINKIDRIGADVEYVIEEIRANLTEDVCNISANLDKRHMSEELVEFIAERDEVLLEQYMDTGYEFELWIQKFKAMIKDNKIFPCASGSALQDIGVGRFFEQLHMLTEARYGSKDEFEGSVYKIRHDENGLKIIFVKALKGNLTIRDEVCYYKGEEKFTEKVTQIRLYNGSKFKAVERVEAGDIFAVTGLSRIAIGDLIGAEQKKNTYKMVPTLQSNVLFDSSLNIKDVLRCFKILDVEDPSLRVTWEENVQEIHLHVMGTIQLEVLQQVVQERFGFPVQFGQPKILYKETIETTVIGYGHFEPLGHYAEVHLKIEPANRNSGISFNNECHVNDLALGQQNLIRHHLFERQHHGLLTGSALTDINVTLLNGRAHEKHTSGGDFREATYRALRQGLEQARNILLEPYYYFKIKVDTDYVGRVLSDIQQAHGRFDPPEIEKDKVKITGTVPVVTFMNYSMEFASITQGKGMLQLVFSGYERCHNEEEVIERIAYDKDADPNYSSSSIFCSKGKGYTVPWEEVKSHMHCL